MSKTKTMEIAIGIKGNGKGNKKLINSNFNYISSAQINESNKFFERYYFLISIEFFSEFLSPQTHESQTC